MRTNITSAAGVLALLEEPETEIKYFALQKLNHIVNQFWAEISESVDKVEMLYEDETFKHRNLAALVASKVKNNTTILILQWWEFFADTFGNC